ncbi:type-F conjugative transfer system protein TraW [Thiotrichales bacterium 19S9-12]|nr:type-F conjugative transfer system protein TraW [Thiotrichales bacterium 19S9-11]MCF6812528.1 type-F conjugative transfer system protein TraW [Thiotrichales bacterium 19S9-12]
MIYVRFILMLLLVLFNQMLYAKILEQGGQTFEVQEEDFRDFIYDRLNHMKETGELAHYEEEAKRRVAHNVNHPPILPLSTQSDTETFTVNPSIQLNKNITDHTGRVLVKAGTTVNPFRTVHLKEVLFFFNGDDKDQVRWVKNNYQKYHWVKFILTGGEIKKLSKIFGRIYYDQKGLITQKLHITHVPAIAEQDHLNWKITVIGRKEFI